MTNWEKNLRGLEQKKRRRCRGGQEVRSLSASRMGRKRVTREKARRGGKGRSRKAGETVSVCEG